MASVPLNKKKDARYHVVAVTNEWAAFVQSMMDVATNSVASRVRDAQQRKRETTYARGELGGH